MAKELSVIKEITRGVYGSLMDLFLWYAALVGASVGKIGSRGIYDAFQEAEESLQKVNHHTLASAWHKLIKKHLLTYKKRKNLYYPEITLLGKRRLAASIPLYQTKRPWDKKFTLSLMTYQKM